MSDSDTPATDTLAPSTLPTDDLRCIICGVGHREHLAMEREGAKAHKFSENGKLVAVEVKKPAPSSSGVGPPAPSDPILRYILISKGIITTDDLDETEKMLSSLGLLVTGPKNAN